MFLRKKMNFFSNPTNDWKIGVKDLPQNLQTEIGTFIPQKFLNEQKSREFSEKFQIQKQFQVQKRQLKLSETRRREKVLRKKWIFLKSY